MLLFWSPSACWMSFFPFIFTAVFLLILCSSLSLASMNSTGRGVKRDCQKGEGERCWNTRGRELTGTKSSKDNRREMLVEGEVRREQRQENIAMRD